MAAVELNCLWMFLYLFLDGRCRAYLFVYVLVSILFLDYRRRRHRNKRVVQSRVNVFYYHVVNSSLAIKRSNILLSSPSRTVNKT